MKRINTPTRLSSMAAFTLVAAIGMACAFKASAKEAAPPAPPTPPPAALIQTVVDQLAPPEAAPSATDQLAAKSTPIYLTITEGKGGAIVLFVESAADVADYRVNQVFVETAGNVGLGSGKFATIKGANVFINSGQTTPGANYAYLDQGDGAVFNSEQGLLTSVNGAKESIGTISLAFNLAGCFATAPPAGTLSAIQNNADSVTIQSPQATAAFENNVNLTTNARQTADTVINVNGTYTESTSASFAAIPAAENARTKVEVNPPATKAFNSEPATIARVRTELAHFSGIAMVVGGKQISSFQTTG